MKMSVVKILLIVVKSHIFLVLIWENEYGVFERFSKVFFRRNYMYEYKWGHRSVDSSGKRNG